MMVTGSNEGWDYFRTASYILVSGPGLLEVLLAQCELRKPQSGKKFAPLVAFGWNPR